MVASFMEESGSSMDCRRSGRSEGSEGVMIGDGTERRIEERASRMFGFMSASVSRLRERGGGTYWNRHP